VSKVIAPNMDETRPHSEMRDPDADMGDSDVDECRAREKRVCEGGQTMGFGHEWICERRERRRDPTERYRVEWHAMNSNAHDDRGVGSLIG